MQWCQEHWDTLRAEIAEQKLSSLVPSSGEDARQAVERQLAGEMSIDTFDPLMGAMWAINSFIGGQLGPQGQLTVLMHDGCPVCKMDEEHNNGELYSRYFPNAVADQVALWQSFLDRP